MEHIATEIYAFEEFRRGVFNSFSAEKRTIVEELVEEIPGVRPVLK